MAEKQKACVVCGNVLEGQKCPVCGCYDPDQIGLREEGTRRDVLEKQRQYYLKHHPVWVDIIGYEYEEADGEIRLKDPNGKVLQSFAVNELLEQETVPGEHPVCWQMQCPYAQIELEDGRPEEITVSFCLRTDGNAPVLTGTQETSLPAPKADGLWYVGLQLEDGLFFHICVGAADSRGQLVKIQHSEKIPFLKK